MAIMPQIKNVVLLMLENRSLDNMLGWLYAAGEKPLHVIPSGSSPDFHGLKPKTYFNDYKNTRIWASAIPSGYEKQLRVPGFDPGETYENVNSQLFGTGNSYHKKNPPFGTVAKMMGFAYDYDAAYESWAELDEIMYSYTPRQLPVLNGLARAFAVSDQWYSSVPTQTNPNRAFSLCGTSLGRVNNSNAEAKEQFKTPTIWNALPKTVDWGLYFQEKWLKTGECFTEYTFPEIKKCLDRGEIATIDRFYSRAKAGTLPAFTYLEPKWGFGKGSLYKQGTDYHPPTRVGPGEAFVNSVYRALRQNPKTWHQTLLIITFDEHGGTYDHIGPKWTAIQPDGHDGPDGFKFNRYGVRIPTLLVTPYVKQRTVFRAGGKLPYDHTSTIATILKWKGVDPAGANLGKRVAAAPTFEGVLSDTARDDAPEFEIPDSFADMSSSEGMPDVLPSVGRYAADNSRSTEEFLEMLRAGD